LALRELGETIDLHGGGSDLIFPHHECERAQSEAATGSPFVKHWMHVAMVFMDGAKMSKSLGNLVFVDALRKEWDPRAIRMAIIQHHYRFEWEWTNDQMPVALKRLNTWVDSLSSPESPNLLNEVRDHLDNDLDTPSAMKAIDEAVSQGFTAQAAANLLGIAL
jgi:L-cysteine:1D-myo-inositol 2-amino-2-deoxy-alpha-D-glucopyranoside ligase